MVSIPSIVFQTYYDIVDDMILDNFGVNCRFIYPPLKTPCGNCYTNTIGGTSTNSYRSGGPAPFNFGNCPVCGGNGLIETEQYDTIKLRVYNRAKDWVKISIPVQIPDGMIQVIGFMYNLPKFEQANYILIDSDLLGYKNFRYERSGEACPHGFGRNRYFVSFMKRSGG